jgi:hypothetical protein
MLEQKQQQYDIPIKLANILLFHMLKMLYEVQNLPEC